MRAFRFILQSLVHYRRSHAATLAGVAIAAAALTGAMLTGYSVRQSLRSLALDRIGRTDWLLASRGFFRDSLASEFQPESKAAPLLSFEAHVTLEASGRRATGIDLHGVDQRFYEFHGTAAAPPQGRDAYLSPALARELQAKPGETILVRVEEPSAIPREFLYGEKEETSRILRLRVADSVTPPAVPEFALRQRQGDVMAVFAPLERLRRDLKKQGEANAVLLSSPWPKEQLQSRLQERFQLEDLGLRLTSLVSTDQTESNLQHESTVIDDRTAAHSVEAGRTLRVLTRPFLTYLANRMTVGSRSSSYALIAGADTETMAELNRDDALANSRLPAILLNDWLAADLAAQPGDELAMEYLVWTPDGRLDKRTTSFHVAGIVPMRGLAADRQLAPDYPGITDQESISGWDPPFPIDLKNVTPRDELYWKLHRATPKAWVPLAVARELWGTRFGSLNTIRFAAPPEQLRPLLRNKLDPLGSQFTLLPVREQALLASSGATDFGEYFLYFSFVLVVAALVLVVLFFRLGVEQRQSEITLLRSLGLEGSGLRLLYMGEGLAVALGGAALGSLLGVGWAALMMEGLRRWWSGATGTSLLRLHVDWQLVFAGGMAGFGFAALTIWLTVRRHEVLVPRAAALPAPRPRWFRRLWSGLSLATLASAALLAGGAADVLPAAGAFFGSAFFLLAALLFAAAIWLRKPTIRLLPEFTLWRLAVRNTAWRPGRSLLCVTLIALSAFLLVSLEAFRQHDEGVSGIWAESLAPIVQDPATLDGLPRAHWTSFRLKPGDDISCLNLYQPRNPQILGLPESYYRTRPIPIAASRAQSPQTVENPWLLLESQLEEGHIPAIVDQNSMMYILHKRLGETILVERGGAEPIKLRIVATTVPGIFQSSILISEKDFVRLFPGIPGWRVFLIDAPLSAIEPMEEALAGYGFDAKPLAEHLASFHRVENTYLSTFQALGGFGLLIGVLGLTAVLLRNALERRAELALLSAVGLAEDQLQRLILYENLALLVAGLAAGTVCALVAVAPALAARGALLPVARIVGLLALILIAGGLSSRMAVKAASSRALLSALRN